MQSATVTASTTRTAPIRRQRLGGDEFVIKSVIALFAFAVLLCAWIVNPFGIFSDEDETVALAAAQATSIDPLGATAGGSVTRGIGLTAVLPTPTGTGAVVAAVQRPDAAAALAPVLQSGQLGLDRGLRTYDAPLGETLQAILDALSGAEDPAQHVADAAADAGSPLDAQLADTLADIAAITQFTPSDRPSVPVGEAAAPGVSAALAAIVAEALRAGRTDADIDYEINRAARAGDIAIPGVLVRADGRVDTQTLLTGVLITLRKSQGIAPQPAVLAVQWTDGAARHDVMADESLAALANRYYGDPTRTDGILAANAAGLVRAGAIAEGQTLTIPAL